jgi:adenylosuccinate synthase
MVLVRSSVTWNSIDTLALTKLDVLDGLDNVKVCMKYRIDQGTASEYGLPTELDYFPSHLRLLERCEPVYIDIPGWKDVDWTAGRIDERVSDYIELIEKGSGAKVGIVSYGPGREETIVR